MRFSGAEIITELLERQQISTLAGIPGGANLPLYDALRASSIRHVLARHEQGAGFIAQGMARVSGRAAVCMATSGPGATNLITAIADAKLDSVPIVAITGQVPYSMMGTDAFQEVDTYGVTLPITKHNFLVRSPQELLEVIPEAFRIAESGRPGPVVIDVPKDVQLAKAEFDAWPKPGQKDEPRPLDGENVRRLAQMLARAQRPLLYIGGGVIAADAAALVRKLAKITSTPVVGTLMALGAMPCDDELYLGMLGMHGWRHTNLAMDEADLLVAVGTRFDDRATGRVEEFCRHADIAHIDIDHSEIDKIKPANLAIVADLKLVLEALLELVEPREMTRWTRRIAQLKTENPPETPSDDVFRPARLISAIGRALEAEDIVTTDVGQHQMWAAQWYPFRRPRTFLTSGGLGTMGFGLPAAIGAALAAPDRKVVCVSGDGSLLMNIQELATLSELGLDVTVVVMDNGHLGLVRQQQELFYGGRYHAVKFEARTNFAAIARGFGIDAVDLGRAKDPLAGLEEAVAAPWPALVNVGIDPDENVFPMVPPGAANRDMIGGTVNVAG